MPGIRGDIGFQVLAFLTATTHNSNRISNILGRNRDLNINIIINIEIFFLEKQDYVPPGLSKTWGDVSSLSRKEPHLFEKNEI